MGNDNVAQATWRSRNPNTHTHTIKPHCTKQQPKSLSVRYPTWYFQDEANHMRHNLSNDTLNQASKRQHEINKPTQNSTNSHTHTPDTLPLKRTAQQGCNMVDCPKLTLTPTEASFRSLPGPRRLYFERLFPLGVGVVSGQ